MLTWLVIDEAGARSSVDHARSFGRADSPCPLLSSVLVPIFACGAAASSKQKEDPFFFGAAMVIENQKSQVATWQGLLLAIAGSCGAAQRSCAALDSCAPPLHPETVARRFRVLTKDT